MRMKLVVLNPKEWRAEASLYWTHSNSLYLNTLYETKHYCSPAAQLWAIASATTVPITLDERYQEKRMRDDVKLRCLEGTISPEIGNPIKLLRMWSFELRPVVASLNRDAIAPVMWSAWSLTTRDCGGLNRADNHREASSSSDAMKLMQTMVILTSLFDRHYMRYPALAIEAWYFLILVNTDCTGRHLIKIWGSVRHTRSGYSRDDIQLIFC